VNNLCSVTFSYELTRPLENPVTRPEAFALCVVTLETLPARAFPRPLTWDKDNTTPFYPSTSPNSVTA